MGTLLEKAIADLLPDLERQTFDADVDESLGLDDEDDDEEGPARLTVDKEDGNGKYQSDVQAYAGIWDESEHPRAPAGTSEGGKFIPKDGPTAGEIVESESQKNILVTRTGGGTKVILDRGGDREQAARLKNELGSILDKVPPAHLRGLKTIDVAGHSLSFLGSATYIPVTGKRGDVEDEIWVSTSWHQKPPAERAKALLHEIGHRVQTVTDPLAFRDFKRAGLDKKLNDVFDEKWKKEFLPQYKKRGLEAVRAEVFAESYAQHLLGTLRDPELKAFWASRKYSHQIYSDAHKFSSTQLNLPSDLQARLDGWVRRNVPAEDLSPDEKLEGEFHVTVLYGLYEADGRGVAKVATGFGPVAFRLGKVQVFDTNPAYDVLYVAVEDAVDLRVLRGRLETLPYTKTQAGYAPHATLAYVKKGAGQRLVGDKTFAGEQVTADRLLFRSLNGDARWVSLLPGAKPYAKPIDPLKQGETLTIGPEGKRGVWRTIGGNPIFVEVKTGESVPEAVRRAEGRTAGTASSVTVPQEKLLEKLAAAEPGRGLPSDPDYLYHATNTENAFDIADSGIQIHAPSFGTDQDAWPDGSTEKRSYFSPRADVVWQFAPEGGKPVVLRVRKDTTDFRAERHTGDVYARKAVPAKHVEILLANGKWYPLQAFARAVRRRIGGES